MWLRLVPPCAAAEAGVVCAQTVFPVVGVIGNTSLVGVNARSACVSELDGLSVTPAATAQAGVIGVEAGLPVVWVVGHAGLVIRDTLVTGKGEGSADEGEGKSEGSHIFYF